MISKNSNFIKSTTGPSINARIEYLRTILGEYIGEDSASNIIIAIFEGHIKTHDEFFVALRHYAKTTPTSKIDKKFDILYIGTTIFPEHVFEELRYGITVPKYKNISEEKIEKTQSRRRKLWSKIFG